MSDFLSRLVHRTLDPALTIRPRPVSLFEPVTTESLPAPALSAEMEDRESEQVGDSETHRPAAARRAFHDPPPALHDDRGEEPEPRARAPRSSRGAGRPRGKRSAPQHPPEGENPPAIEPVGSRQPSLSRILAPRAEDATLEGTRPVPRVEAAFVAPPAMHPPHVPGGDVSGREERRQEAMLLAPSAVADIAPREAPRPQTSTGVDPHDHPASGSDEPEIHVTIGRVEVRAVSGQGAARPTSSTRGPKMTLDEYLRDRSSGRR